MRSSALVWESLARDGREVVTKSELDKLASRLNKNPKNTIDHLVRGNYLTPLFRGTYRVNTPAEVRLGVPERNHLELFAVGAREKGLRHWYFGLHTALRLNGLTHEYLTVETVINDKLYRPKGIEIGGRLFILHKWNTTITRFGITRESGLPVSDREKTVLDLAYHEFWAERRGRKTPGDWCAHLDNVDTERFLDYLERFPPSFREWAMPWT